MAAPASGFDEGSSARATRGERERQPGRVKAREELLLGICRFFAPDRPGSLGRVDCSGAAVVRYCTPESSAVTRSTVLPSATFALPAELATVPRPLQ